LLFRYFLVAPVCYTATNNQTRRDRLSQQPIRRKIVNMRRRVHPSRIRGQDQSSVRQTLLLSVIALCAVALIFPAAADADAASQHAEGYGTAWFVDPGEWYEATEDAVALASKALSGQERYGTAWYVDPGEWYEATEDAVSLTSEALSGQERYGTAWYVDPGEACAKC
jgi:hypothetical protein